MVGVDVNLSYQSVLYMHNLVGLVGNATLVCDDDGGDAFLLVELCKSCITSTLVFESSAPVGSSARIISGFVISALAIATRCFCPPDISLG